MVIGVAKCGTTTLCNTLAGHPDIFFSKPKELNYFNKTVRYEATRGEYEKAFEGAENYHLRGEGSVGYTNPNRLRFIPRRIHEAIPDCRLVLMVRHPIRRMESDWKMRFRLGDTEKSFNEALQGDISLINHGLYWNILTAYLKHFDKEQILIVFLEDLNASFDTEMSRVLRHIGADTKSTLTKVCSNISDGYRQDTTLSTNLKKYLHGSIKSAVPESVKKMIRHVTTKEWSYDIKWDSQVYEDVVQHSILDSQALLDYCGKSSDYWDFSYPENHNNL